MNISRHEKGLAQDQKRGMEKLGMIKRRDTRYPFI